MNLDEMIARQQARLAVRPEPKPEAPLPEEPLRASQKAPSVPVEALEHGRLDLLASQLGNLLAEGAPSIKLSRMAAGVCQIALRTAAYMARESRGISSCPVCMGGQNSPDEGCNHTFHEAQNEVQNSPALLREKASQGKL